MSLTDPLTSASSQDRAVAMLRISRLRSSDSIGRLGAVEELDAAPYGHNGSFRMLDEIIAAHGGDARFSRDQYLALDPAERDDVVAFMRNLVIEAPL